MGAASGSPTPTLWLRIKFHCSVARSASLMRVLASLIQRLVPDGRRLKPREVVAEFDKHLHDELEILHAHLVEGFVYPKISIQGLVDRLHVEY